MTGVIHHGIELFCQQVSVGTIKGLLRLADDPSCLVHNPIEFILVALRDIPTPTDQTIFPDTGNDGFVKDGKDTFVDIKNIQFAETIHPHIEFFHDWESHGSLTIRLPNFQIKIVQG